MQDAPRTPPPSPGQYPSPYGQQPSPYGQPPPNAQSGYPGYPPPQPGYPPPQGYPPQPGYPQPPYPYVPSAAPPQETSGAAVASLICGIATWFIIPFLGAIAAIITGHIALGRIKRSGGQIKGRGMAIAGLILGYLNIVVWIGIVAFFIVAASHGSTTSPRVFLF